MKSLVTLFVIVAVLAVGYITGQSQVGGPYETDANTVLLMHFDNDLTNESEFSADGIGYGDLYYIPNNVPDLNQCLRIDNDSESDSSCVTVADTAALDLIGDWTMEGWINVFTFGEGSSDWRWVPRLFIKTGDEVFWRPNYFVELWGNNRMFSCGYQSADQSSWPQVNTPDNTMEPGKWYHLTFIRDTSRHLLLQIVHNADREMIVFATADYNSFAAPPDTPPIVTDKPVYIGFAGGGGDSWLDGFVDEIRISNVVREIPIPPVITNVTQVGNQLSSVASYDVGANIETLFGTLVQTATLHINTGAAWEELPMTEVQADSFAATIIGQPLGTMIKYYVSAEDENGFRSVNPQTAESAVPAFYSFGIYTPTTQTLELTFEEGAGIPIDVSAYGNIVTMVGNPTFSTEAIDGNYCIELEGDSSYLEIDSPFLNSEQFTVDFWFNADSIRTYCRIINRPIEASNWYQNTYQIRFNADNVITAGSYMPDESGRYLNEDLALDSTVTTGKWYHAIYEVADTTAIFQLRDENDDFIDQKCTTISSVPLQATAPLRIGYAAGRAHFCGRFDNIKIYNYAAAGLVSSLKPINDAELPQCVELSQNYPNPFNPTTEIQFAIPTYQKVTLTVYNLLGRKVKTLVDKKVAAGKYSISWDGKDELGINAASGVYFYKLKSENVVDVRKMLLVR